MVRLINIAGAASALAGIAQAAFSGAHYTLNYPDQLNGAVDVTHFRTTLVVPKAPHPETDTLALWPGVQSKKGPDGLVGLVQSIAASFGHPQNPKPDGCNGNPGQWCAFTYEFVSKQGASKQGPTVAVDAGSHLMMEYVKQGANYHQTITLNGKVISSFTDNSHGAGYCFYTAVECHAPFDEAAPAHKYLNTTITLSGQHPNFKNTLTQNLVDASPLHTTDGGKTWKIDHIDVKQSHCNASGSTDNQTWEQAYPIY